MTKNAQNSGLLTGIASQNRYRIISRIGEGGVGTVYKVKHEPIGQLYALKVIHQALAENPVVVARFQREAKAAAAVGEEHFVKIFDTGYLDNGSPYIVTELLEGRDLAAALSFERQMPIVRAVDIAQQCCRALSKAHTKGIVHGDIKPENIFLKAQSDGSEFVKILDFGVSKMLDAAAGLKDAALTENGTAPGTPDYHSVEQVNGSSNIDARTDVYAMGGVLLRMLIGRAPFEAPTYGALLTKIVNDPPPSLVEARSDIPLALEQVVHRALAKNRDQRFGSIAELAEALAPFAAYEVAELTSISQSELTRQLARIATSLRRFFSERVPSASSIRALGVSLQSVRERRTRQLIPRLSNSSTLVGIGVGVGIALAIVLPLAHSYISRQAASPDAVAPSANAHEVRFVTPTAGDQTRTDRPKGVSISTQVSALSASSELIAAKPDTSVAVSARTAASGRVVSNTSNKKRPVRLVVDVEKTARKTPVQQEPTRKTRAKSAALRGAILPGVDGRKQLDTKARTVKLRNAVRASVKVTFRCAGVLITANVPPQGQASAALPPESCQVSCVGMGGPVCPKALSANTGSLEIL